MKAVVVTELGPPHVLTLASVPDPSPTSGSVVVRVAAASVTFVETMIRAGRCPGLRAPSLPYIPGNGVAGVVESIGAGVPEHLLGQRVVSTTGGAGGYAERVVVPASQLIPIPSNLDFEAAAALIADGRSALALSRRSRVTADDRVLVTAAAGGVGTLLVQLLVQAGAEVVAAVGSERKAEVARDLGAHHVVDYSSDAWPSAVAALGGVSVVFDGVGGAVGEAAFEVLPDGGRQLMYGMASGSFADVSEERARGRGIEVSRGIGGSPAEWYALSTEALELASAGALRPLVGQVYPLARAAEAHAAIEARVTLGKTLLATDFGLGAHSSARSSSSVSK